MSPPRVALFVETSRAYGRSVLQGVWQYVKEHDRWSILFRPRGLEEPTPAWMASWSGDGIIAHVNNTRTARLLQKSAARCVDVLGDVEGFGFPFIGTDNARIAHMATEHLLYTGLRNFAVCGLRKGQRPRLDDRCEAFEALIHEAGHPCHVYRPRGGGRYGPSWTQEQKQIAEWLKTLPRPIGIFACNDVRGRELLDACQTAGISVPEQAVVLGVGNDDILCELSEQRLSSIDVNPVRIGYQAADMLCRMMAGERVEPSITVPPRRVIERQSTNVLAVDDQEVAAAIQFIRLHACDAIDVSEVVHRVGLSRRVLERRFRMLLRRSIKAEIVRVRLDRAKELLAETSLSATTIAKRCGFSTPAYFMDHFHQRVGVTPIRFREVNRMNWTSGQASKDDDQAYPTEEHPAYEGS